MGGCEGLQLAPCAVLFRADSLATCAPSPAPLERTAYPSLFHKALKEAFEAFCNKSVAGSTSAELFANFCDNLLKKVGLRAGLG